MVRKIIAFDIDGTLDISEMDKGPIPVSIIEHFIKIGWRVGLCGNYKPVVDKLPKLDFYGPDGLIPFEPNPGPRKLEQLKIEGKGYDIKIFVGDAESDKEAARQAGWKFLYPNAIPTIIIK